MKRIQKAVIVTHPANGSSSLSKLNVLLENGWRVMRMAPMGGAGQASSTPLQFAALVIIEQTARTETDVEIAAEAEVQDLEENGAPEDSV